MGNNRPNIADHGAKIGEMLFVKGTVRHSGREHSDLKLVGWHRAIPNNSKNSFQATGDID